MKENILKRLQKYNMGGMPTMPTQLMPQMNTPGPTGPAYPTLERGIIGGTAPNPFKSLMDLGQTIYNNRSNISNAFTPKPGINTDPLLGKMQMGGAQPLPGGVMAPIPGSDAVEFMGNKHDESGMGSDSGIMVDQQTEVEDGETMDQVTMKDGGKRDYFFSSYLKKGGKSYADMHKNMLQMGGTQEDVDYLAKMQEKAAGRDPKQVAKLGGVVKYQRAGARVSMDDIMALDPTYAQGISDIQNYTSNQARAEAAYKESQERMDRNFAAGNYLYDDEDITFVDSQTGEIVGNPGLSYPGGEGFDAGEMYPGRLDQTSYAGIYQTEPSNDYSDGTSEQDIRDFQTRVNFNVPQPGEETEAQSQTPMYSSAQMPANATNKSKKGYYTASEFEKEEERKKMVEGLKKGLNKGAVPLAATIGLGTQLLPAIGAMLTKQKDLEKFSYTPGFTSPIVAGRVRGLKYEAPNQDEARSRLASAYTGQQKFLDTSGGGSTNFANRQALFAKKLQGEGTLGAQESKDRLAAENLSKQSQQKAEMMNVQNELKAASVNAQMIQREADRRQTVDNANAQLKNMRSNEKIQNRMTILNNLAQGVATGAGDYMQYKASDRLARATGIYGIYERDKIKNMLLNNPAFQNMSEADKNKEIAKMYNQLIN